MAIIQYRDHMASPAVDAQLASLAQQTMSTRGMLTMLGDYWVDYYRDTPTLAQAHSGFVAAAGRQMTRLLETIKSGNILDLPVEQGLAFDLLIFNRSDFVTTYDAEGNISSYYVSLEGCDINNIEFLTVSLFESPVILQKGLHYRIADKGIYFYVDIFNDPSITTYEYQMSDDAQQSVLLWGCSIALNSYYIYQRYGRFLYRKAVDSYQYRWTVTSLMRYYTGAKTPSNIRDILDILFGIPYARYDGEVIKDITWVNEDLTEWTEHERHDEAPYVRITTDRGTYYSYGLSTVKYKVGDAVSKNELFCSFCDVLDYINSPEWWKTASMGFPDYLFSDQDSAENMSDSEKYDIMDKILKYNTVYTQVNITFESYDLYMQILEDLYTIIRTGFPVYLNPYVEVIFRMLFLDDFNLTDVAKDELFLKLMLVFSDPFPQVLDVGPQMIMRMPNIWDKWGFNKIYDGRFHYDAEIDHSPVDLLGWERFYLDIGYNPQDTYDVRKRVNDANHHFHLHRTFSDPFCPFVLYDGKHYYSGYHQHDLWNHTGNRMLDKLALNINIPNFCDLVRFKPLYDGRFIHRSEITYGGGYTFAADTLRTLNVGVNIESQYHKVKDLYLQANVHWTPEPDKYAGATDKGALLDLFLRMADQAQHANDSLDRIDMRATFETKYETVEDKGFVANVAIEPWRDPFCPYMKYDGMRYYDGRDRHTLWVHDDNRMLDRLRMHITMQEMRDRVLFAKTYNGRYTHADLIDYGPYDTFALDLFNTTYAVYLTDRMNEIFDGLRQGLELGLSDRYEHETTDEMGTLGMTVELSDEGLQPDELPNTYAGELAFESNIQLRGTELKRHVTFAQSFIDAFCPYMRYNGLRHYDGKDFHTLWVHDEGRLTDRIKALRIGCHFASKFRKAKETLWQKLQLSFSDAVKFADSIETKLRVKLADTAPKVTDRELSFASIMEPLSDTIADTPCYLYYGGVAQYAGDCDHNENDGNELACDGLIININKRVAKRKRAKRRFTIFL
ncbi:hypothetical protein B5F76_05835 [Desulfovibrio sp. An276]|uniref:hypothetical protein n=1 Tax=Desulfovibrio sp. An276 TaxID=1965618 RepID=UPI000B37FD17|nr:hypothetical protein [Desulfovibrio sp. An276]OUO53297.1 hypothetical protein B5F76_05835 [Desulfovibrio sp. An276]